MRRLKPIDIEAHTKLRERVKKYKEGGEEKQSQLVHEIGNEFLRFADLGDDIRIAAIIDEGFPVNYQDKRNGETALHYAAATDARDVVRVLVESGRCDYLIRDIWGRLPSELALVHGDDPALARLLRIKERKQAQAQGIKPTRRPAHPS